MVNPSKIYHCIHLSMICDLSKIAILFLNFEIIEILPHCGNV